MTIYSILIQFAIITAIHYLSLKIQDKYKFYTKHFGKHGFTVHGILTGILWLWLIRLFFWNDVNFNINPLPFYTQFFKPIGMIIKILGIVLILWSGWMLGIKRMWGIRYFEKNYKNKIERSGPYKYLKNPIYLGFFLSFLGNALRSNSLYYFFIAAETYLLFNILLVRFENKEIH